MRPAVTSANGVSAQAQRAQWVTDQIPFVAKSGGGQGVNAQRKNIPKAQDQIPKTLKNPGGSGVSAQRTPGQIPHVANWGGGQGVSAQRLSVPDQRPMSVGNRVAAHRRTRPDLVEWFRAIQERLKGVIVLNRSWESALTPTLLMHTPTAPKPPVGILLDPPYFSP